MFYILTSTAAFIILFAMIYFFLEFFKYLRDIRMALDAKEDRVCDECGKVLLAAKETRGGLFKREVPQEVKCLWCGSKYLIV